MTRPFLTTRSGRWLLSSVLIVQSKLARLLSTFGVSNHQANARLGRSRGTLRGPILWLGDLRKRRDRDSN
jgi:hypothetical protein